MMQEVCRPGQCIRCGADFEPTTYCEVSMTLTDQSTLRVGVCIHCKDKIWEEDKADIWNALLRGWEAQIEKAGWPKAKKDKYLANYAKKGIA